ILGSEDQGIYLTAVTSTAPGIGANDSYFTEGRWVVAPAGFTGQTSVAIDTGNGPEVNKITYVTPTFSGLTLGATFAPGANSSYGRDNYTHANAGTLGEAWGAAAQYKNKFGGFDVAASAGYMVTDVQNQLRDPLKEWNAGLNLGFAGFTVGGSYRDLSAKDPATGRKAFMDGYAWEAGVAYQTGPFGVGLNYFRSTAEASIANRNKDKQTVWSLNGNYEMGPGVNLIAGIANVKYDGEGTTAADDNRGWAGVTGFKLTF
ncbi:MAG: porin, partial [Rhodospirillales bacterium]|nr:porin [Rhodospirillales bacterium]